MGTQKKGSKGSREQFLGIGRKLGFPIVAQELQCPIVQPSLDWITVKQPLSPTFPSPKAQVSRTRVTVPFTSIYAPGLDLLLILVGSSIKLSVQLDSTEVENLTSSVSLESKAD